MYCNYHQDDWANILQTAEFAYNNSKNAVTGLNPVEILMDYSPTFHTGVKDGNPEEGRQTVLQRVKALTQAQSHADTPWEHVSATQTRNYNKKHQPQSFAIGDKVILNAKNIQLERPQKKLDHKFLSLFEIKGIVGKQAY
jgi:nicotinamidase-related amidase